MNEIKIFLVIQILLLSCRTSGNEKAGVNNNDSGAILAAGQKVYQTYCMVCHQNDGMGVSQLYPPLGGTEWVTGNKERLISILLYGLKEPIIVKGEEYENMMPPHSFLNDENIAAVLTYIRTSFGNNASEITPEEVSKIRNKEVSY
jgi:mono/diheme cytochrome c family protein